jgi:hypothetical protein
MRWGFGAFVELSSNSGSRSGICPLPANPLDVALFEGPVHKIEILVADRHGLRRQQASDGVIDQLGTNPLELAEP